MVALEGTRSFGVGMARALATAGLPVVEIERPARRDRRRGKSDPIDAHLAAVNALRLDADRLPLPRADGDREALRILLGARRELATARTRMVNRLRALLLTGDDHDRTLARGPMSPAALTAIARRRARREESREQAVRRVEARRLAVGIRDAGVELKNNKKQLAALVGDLAPGLMDKVGVGPVSGAQTIVSYRTGAAAATTPPSPPSPAPAHCLPAADGSCATGSTAAATANSTGP